MRALALVIKLLMLASFIDLNVSGARLHLIACWHCKSVCSVAAISFARLLGVVPAGALSPFGFRTDAEEPAFLDLVFWTVWALSWPLRSTASPLPGSSLPSVCSPGLLSSLSLPSLP